MLARVLDHAAPFVAVLAIEVEAFAPRGVRWESLSWT
jgi:hypothetical protein